MANISTRQTIMYSFLVPRLNHLYYPGPDYLISQFHNSLLSQRLFNCKCKIFQIKNSDYHFTIQLVMLYIYVIDSEGQKMYVPTVVYTNMVHFPIIGRNPLQGGGEVELRYNSDGDVRKPFLGFVLCKLRVFFFFWGGRGRNFVVTF